MPLPSWLRPRASSTRWKRSNMRGSASAGMPMPVSRTVKREIDLALASSDTAMLACERELERVREQVEDDLLPHLAVDVDRLGQRRAVDRRGAARRARTPSGSCSPGRRSAPRGRSARRWPARGPASMRAKSSSVLTSLSRRWPLRCTSSSCARSSGGELLRASSVLQRAEHQRERRAELVADVAEERGLGAVELGERLGAPALVLERLDRGNGAGDVRAHQAEEIERRRHRTARCGLIPADQRCRDGSPRPGSGDLQRPPRRPTRTSSVLAAQRPRAVERRHRCRTTPPASLAAVERGERQILAVALEHRAGVAQHVARVEAPTPMPPRSRSAARRRSPMMRPVVSLTMQNRPPTRPVSSRTGS